MTKGKHAAAIVTGEAIRYAMRAMKSRQRNERRVQSHEDIPYDV
ncbi:hypothetical protein [Burkholderia mayonis]|nr:hypothetical protein [Burkholderia mayonis]